MMAAQNEARCHGRHARINVRLSLKEQEAYSVLEVLLTNAIERWKPDSWPMGAWDNQTLEDLSYDLHTIAEYVGAMALDTLRRELDEAKAEAEKEKAQKHDSATNR